MLVLWAWFGETTPRYGPNLGFQGASAGGAPPNKRLKLTGHRALQISVLPSGHEIKRLQLPGHLGRQLSREPLDGTNQSLLEQDCGDTVKFHQMTRPWHQHACRVRLGAALAR